MALNLTLFNTKFISLKLFVFAFPEIPLFTLLCSTTLHFKLISCVLHSYYLLLRMLSISAKWYFFKQLSMRPICLPEFCHCILCVYSYLFRQNLLVFLYMGYFNSFTVSLSHLSSLLIFPFIKFWFTTFLLVLI